jgi:hypothetical protein
MAEWIAKMCAPTPAERFTSAKAALDALASAAPSAGANASAGAWAVALPKSIPRPVIYGAAGFAALLVVITAIAMIASRRAEQAREQQALEDEQRQIEQRRAEARQASSNVGCADGTREAFKDALTYPEIAGCAGAFTVPGLNVETPPSCDRNAGNDGANLLGAGCGASDLCAVGFHVCRSAPEVAAKSRNGCKGANDSAPGAFFATRQSGPGCMQCATGDDPGCDHDACRPGCAPTPELADDLFGCGSTGIVLTNVSCAPLTRNSGNLCSALPSSWHCKGGANAAHREAAVVAKPESTGGGVLCCAD